jgi:hypothetical protein
MVDYVTRADLSSAAGTLNEQASTIQKAERRSVEGSTFLSHSTKDVDLLPGVIKLLERHGATVYIDKKDEKLPPYTNRETAIALRNNVKKMKKFVLFTTLKSKDSRWIPWELGLADGHRDPSNIAILPGVENQTETAWVKQEYLGVYDRIVRGPLQGHSGEVYMVWNQEKNTATELSAWLQR